MWAEKMAKPTFGVVVMCASVTLIHVDWLRRRRDEAIADRRIGRSPTAAAQIESQPGSGLKMQREIRQR